MTISKCKYRYNGNWPVILHVINNFFMNRNNHRYFEYFRKNAKDHPLIENTLYLLLIGTILSFHQRNDWIINSIENKYKQTDILH